MTHHPNDDWAGTKGAGPLHPLNREQAWWGAASGNVSELINLPIWETSTDTNLNGYKLVPMPRFKPVWIIFIFAGELEEPRKSSTSGNKGSKWFIFYFSFFFFLRQGSCYIVQAGLKLLSSSNPPTSTSLVTRTTDMHHLSFLDSCYYCYNTVYTRYKQNTLSLSVWVHACNPSTKESEAGRLWVWGQTALHKETLSNKRTTKTTKPSLSFPN
jgi:hypothetical protein